MFNDTPPVSTQFDIVPILEFSVIKELKYHTWKHIVTFCLAQGLRLVLEPFEGIRFSQI